MMLDTGIYGAKVQSWRRANPRDLLKRVIEENAGATEAEILAAFRQRVKEPDNEDHLDSVIEYWHTNNYRSLINPIARQEQRARAQAATREAVEVVKEKVRTRIQEEARLMLLDLVMPNGKQLRACTGKECGKFGGWLARVGQKVGPRKVGDVLSEAQVRKLFSK